MIKAIIFDCFGVIITDALDAICAELGIIDRDKLLEVSDMVQLANRGLISLRESRQKVASILGISSEDYDKRIANGEAKDQRLLDYIMSLRKTYKTGLLSNISNGGLHLRFTEDELKKYFDFVVASGDIGFAKPEAQAYEYAADGLEVRLDECVFIDDREDYCLAAQGVGMKAIQYQSFQQARAELEALLYDSKS